MKKPIVTGKRVEEYIKENTKVTYETETKNYIFWTTEQKVRKESKPNFCIFKWRILVEEVVNSLVEKDLVLKTLLEPLLTWDEVSYKNGYCNTSYTLGGEYSI